MSKLETVSKLARQICEQNQDIQKETPEDRIAYEHLLQGIQELLKNQLELIKSQKTLSSQLMSIQMNQRDLNLKISLLNKGQK
ncbi:hypothetical protein MM239_16005 [Belliella sp. DSM 111904]|uniref:Uncharacterized protein n=1 Tax=Belliella filtrata TaxID=2923435 RepID=A0ABS9V3D0_9BACT|nr:hypothetical protein [Belliella filtrata]MCH7410913.1 hypothetical protein [Belliella filtrata]